MSTTSTTGTTMKLGRKRYLWIGAVVGIGVGLGVATAITGFILLPWLLHGGVLGSEDWQTIAVGGGTTIVFSISRQSGKLGARRPRSVSEMKTSQETPSTQAFTKAAATSGLAYDAGTATPVLAKIDWPSVPAMNCRNAQAASGFWVVDDIT